MQRSPMITVRRGQYVPPAAQVLEHVRAFGAVARDDIAAGTGLSAATVRRAVGQLAEAGLVRERPDLVRAGAVGRPGIPTEVDPTHYVTIGFHIGQRIDSVALGDLSGRVVASEEIRRTGGEPDLAALSRAAAELLGREPGRLPLAVGLVGSWRSLRLDPRRLAADLHELTGLEVRTGEHIAAVAAAEFFHRRHGTPGITLYVYARDTMGVAVAADKGEQTEVSRAGRYDHFPTRSDVVCWCGRTGCLGVTASDEALAAAARRAGLISGAVEELYAIAEDPAAYALLAERARLLGEFAAFARDAIDPDRIVLVGQAFTGCPQVLDVITSTYETSTALGPVPVSFTRFGAGIQAITACTLGLGPVYDDPLAVVRTFGARPLASA